MLNELIVEVAGLQFYALADVRDALVQGIRLRPQRDPKNPKDKNAISLWLDREEAEKWEILGLIKNDDGHRRRWMIGHLRRTDAAMFAQFMDKGLSLNVFVYGGDRDGPWSLDVRLEGEVIDAWNEKQAKRREAEERDEAALEAAYPLDRIDDWQKR